MKKTLYMVGVCSLEGSFRSGTTVFVNLAMLIASLKTWQTSLTSQQGQLVH